MTKERKEELAAQAGEVFRALQELTIQATASNTETLAKVYGLLRYVYRGLTEETEETADV